MKPGSNAFRYALMIGLSETPFIHWRGALNYGFLVTLSTRRAKPLRVKYRLYFKICARNIIGRCVGGEARGSMEKERRMASKWDIEVSPE